MSDPDSATQKRYMKQALRLAARARGQVSPNPLVGAVVVKDGHILGSGFHIYREKHHAEVVALEQAGPGAAAADLYVTLEPCSHFGRTPPCVDRIIEAGIARVFMAVRDPNPQAEGGVGRLRQAGIQVVEDVCCEEAAQLNEIFFHYIRGGTPFVTLKLALSLDGKIATPAGQSQWITAQRSRRRVHLLRYEYDAVLVGSRTIGLDDPSLNVRGDRRNPITRVVLDSKLQISPGARLFQSPDPVIIFHSVDAPAERKRQLKEKALLLPAPMVGGLLEWGGMLRELGDRRITSLLLEGGSRVAASALRHRVVQKVHFFYGPIIIGGSELPAVGNLGVLKLDDALRLSGISVKRLGEDVLVTGYLSPPQAASV